MHMYTFYTRARAHTCTQTYTTYDFQLFRFTLFAFLFGSFSVALVLTLSRPSVGLSDFVVP